MSEIQGIVSGVFTIVLMVTFLAIWLWAWRPRHRPTFDALAGLPLEDLSDDRAIPAAPSRLVRRDMSAAEVAPTTDLANRADRGKLAKLAGGTSDGRAEAPQREQAK